MIKNLEQINTATCQFCKKESTSKIRPIYRRDYVCHRCVKERNLYDALDGIEEI